MNYSFTELMKINDSSENEKSTCAITMLWKNAQYMETGQNFVRNRFLNLETYITILNGAASFNTVDSKMVEMYSDRNDNLGSYLKIIATVTSIQTIPSTPASVTFSIDNQLYGDDGWCDALWARIRSIMGLADSVLNSNNFQFTSLIFEFHN